MKISFITTVLNEEGSVLEFLKSLSNQSKIPDEIIIVDGGSTDKTLSVISNFPFGLAQDGQFPISNKKIKVLKKSGNRAVGRNEAIKHATNDIIVCSDVGCILDKNWVKNIIEPFNDSKVDIVSGFYSYKANSIFQKCLASYVLVMPDRANAKEFLPSTRSMAIRKSVWREAGGFPKQYSFNEDYVFALRLKKMGKRFHFAKDAIVYWLPRENLKKSFLMFYYFAKGDMEAGIIRPKVILLFARYIIGLLLLTLGIGRFWLMQYLFFGIIFYLFWAIVKNYRYVKDLRAIFILPLLQITSDISVIIGTSLGFLENIWDTRKKQ